MEAPKELSENIIPTDKLEKDIKKAWRGWRLWVVGELVVIAALSFFLDFPGALSYLRWNWIIEKHSINIAGSILVLSVAYIIIAVVFVMRGGFERWVLKGYEADGKWDYIIGNALMGAFILPLDLASEGGFVFYLASGRIPESLLLMGFAVGLSFVWAPFSFRIFRRMAGPMAEKAERVEAAAAVGFIWGFLLPVTEPAEPNIESGIDPSGKKTNRIALAVEDLTLLVILIVIVYRWKYYMFIIGHHSMGLLIILAIVVALAVSVHLVFAPWRERVSADINQVIERIRIASKFVFGVAMTLIILYTIDFFPAVNGLSFITIPMVNLAFIAALAWVFCRFWSLIFRSV